MPEPITCHLLLDDARGIYIPQAFTRDFDHESDEGWRGIDPSDLAACEDPDNEGYWEAWDSIIQSAYFIMDGVRYTLWQDGSLFAQAEGCTQDGCFCKDDN